MFNFNMSYAECVRGLLDAHQHNKLLSSFEVECLRRSLENNRDTITLLQIYPLSEDLKNLVRHSLMQYVSQCGYEYIDLSCYEPLYGRRMKSYSAFEKYYADLPSLGDDIPVLKVLKDFWLEMRQREDIKDKLLQAEQQRYQLRLDLFYRKNNPYFDENTNRIQSTHQLSDFLTIQQDFDNYLNHLESVQSYWAENRNQMLSILFKRIEMLSGDRRREAEERLLLCLDYCRTAYHLSDNKYCHGKNYLHEMGLHSKILDDHPFLMADQSADLCVQRNHIIAMMQPFISVEAIHHKRTFSADLYEIYLKAAGYQREIMTLHTYTLKNDIDKERLQAQFLRAYWHDGMSLAEQDILKAEFCYAYRDFSQPENEILSRAQIFLKSQHAFERQEDVRVKLRAPFMRKTTEDILESMVSIGCFVDRGHLDTVIAILGAPDLLKQMHQKAQKALSLDETGQYSTHSPLSRESFCNHYANYIQQRFPLNATLIDNPTLSFNHDDLCLYQRITRPVPSQLRHLGWSQEALCSFLKSGRRPLSSENIDNLGIICACVGYDRALGLLLSQKGLNSNLYDNQHTMRSLLGIAISNNHLHVVQTLIDNGADIHSDNAKPGVPAVILASSLKKSTDILKMLIESGANIEAKEQHRIVGIGNVGKGNTALLEACCVGHLEAIKVLIKAGADINAQNNDGNTALLFAVSSSHWEVVEYLMRETMPDINIQNNRHETVMDYCFDEKMRSLLIRPNPRPINFSNQQQAAAQDDESAQRQNDILDFVSRISAMPRI